MKKIYVAPEFEELLIVSSDDILMSPIEGDATDDLLNGLPGIGGETGTDDWNKDDTTSDDNTSDDGVDWTP